MRLWQLLSSLHAYGMLKWRHSTRSPSPYLIKMLLKYQTRELLLYEQFAAKRCNYWRVIFCKKVQLIISRHLSRTKLKNDAFIAYIKDKSLIPYWEIGFYFVLYRCQKGNLLIGSRTWSHQTARDSLATYPRNRVFF